jgi:hypothetical protein
MNARGALSCGMIRERRDQRRAYVLSALVRVNVDVQLRRVTHREVGEAPPERQVGKQGVAGGIFETADHIAHDALACVAPIRVDRNEGVSGEMRKIASEPALAKLNPFRFISERLPRARRKEDVIEIRDRLRPVALEIEPAANLDLRPSKPIRRRPG